MNCVLRKSNIGEICAARGKGSADTFLEAEKISVFGDLEIIGTIGFRSGIRIVSCNSIYIIERISGQGIESFCRYSSRAAEPGIPVSIVPAVFAVIVTSAVSFSVLTVTGNSFPMNPR